MTHLAETRAAIRLPSDSIPCDVDGRLPGDRSKRLAKESTAPRKDWCGFFMDHGKSFAKQTFIVASLANILFFVASFSKTSIFPILRDLR